MLRKQAPEKITSKHLKSIQKRINNLQNNRIFCSIILSTTKQRKFLSKYKKILKVFLEKDLLEQPDPLREIRTRIDNISQRIDGCIEILDPVNLSDIPTVYLLPQKQIRKLRMLLHLLSSNCILEKQFVRMGSPLRSLERSLACQLIELFEEFSLPIKATRDTPVTKESLFNKTLREAIGLVRSAPNNVNFLWESYRKRKK